MDYLQKLYRAIILDIELYEEVEADKTLTRQAMMTVAIVATIESIFHLGSEDSIIIIGSIEAALGSIIRWVLWAFLIAFVGTRILPEPETDSDTGELLRTLGFAYAPGIFYIFSSVPIIGFFVQLVVPFWQLASMTVAVRQALDFSSTTRAIGVCVVAIVLTMIILSATLIASLSLGSIISNALQPASPVLGDLIQT